MRSLYSFLLYLMLPVLFLRLFWRSRRLPAYRVGLTQRLGFDLPSFHNSFWVHAVSVGEVVAAIPLIKRLQLIYPELSFVVTTMTPTGAERIKAALGKTITHCYLPYDTSEGMRRFVDAIQPKIGIIIETELWPNLLHICQQRKIPMCLMNARLSEKSAQGYQRFSSITKPMLQTLSIIAAQSAVDAKRFIALGADANKVVTTGNIKFDLALPDDLFEQAASIRMHWGAKRFIWVAASTHAGEEEIILDAHQKLQTIIPDALLILVPRHPDRFEEVAAQVASQLSMRRRSLNEIVQAETAVYLADTMGELLLFYGVAHSVFIGGSLVPRGGHNSIEAAACAKPILIGPHIFNFVTITALFKVANAITVVSDGETLANELIHHAKYPDEAKAMGERAFGVYQANQGALEKQVQLIDQTLTQQRMQEFQI